MLGVIFAADPSRLREGHGAHTLSVVRPFAINRVRTAPEPPRRKIAARNPDDLRAAIGTESR